MGERSERIRAQQRQGPMPTPEDAYKALLAMIAPHLDCETEQVGHCVYCRSHGKRLWQGAAMTAEEKAAVREECERLGVPVGESPHG